MIVFILPNVKVAMAPWNVTFLLYQCISFYSQKGASFAHVFCNNSYCARRRSARDILSQRAARYTERGVSEVRESETLFKFSCIASIGGQKMHSWAIFIFCLSRISFITSQSPCNDREIRLVSWRAMHAPFSMSD